MLTGQRNLVVSRRLALRYLGWLVNETRLPHGAHQKAAGELAATLVEVGVPQAQIDAILTKTVVPIVPFEVTHRTLEKIPDKREVKASFTVGLYEANKEDATLYAQAREAVAALTDPLLKADYLARLYSSAHEEFTASAMALLPAVPTPKEQIATLEVYIKLAERGFEPARVQARTLIATLPMSFADRAGEFLARLGAPADIAAAKAKAAVSRPPYRIWAALAQHGDAETIAQVKGLTLADDRMRLGVLPIWLKLAKTDASIHPQLLAELKGLDVNHPLWFEIHAQASLLFPGETFAKPAPRVGYLQAQVQKNNITEVQPIALFCDVLRETAQTRTLPVDAPWVDVGFGMDLPAILAREDEGEKLQLLRGYIDRDEVSREEAQQIKNVLLGVAAPKKGKVPTSKENFQLALEGLFALGRHDSKVMSDITNPMFVEPAGARVKMIADHKDILYLSFVTFRDERNFSFRPQHLALEYAMQAECKPEVALQIIIGLSKNFYLERGLSEYCDHLQKAGWTPTQCVEMMRYVYKAHGAVPEPKVLQAFSASVDLRHDLIPQLAERTAYFKSVFTSIPEASSPYACAEHLIKGENAEALRMAYYLEYLGKQKYREVANYSFAKFSKQVLITAHMVAAPDVMAQYAAVCESAATLPRAAWHAIQAKLFAGTWPFSSNSSGEYILAATPGRKKEQKFTIEYIPGADLLATFRFADGVGSCLVSRNKMRHIDMTYMGMSPFSTNFTMRDEEGVNVGFVTCTLGYVTLPDGHKEPAVIANQLYCAETEARMNPDSRLSTFAHQWIQENFAKLIGAQHYVVAFQDFIGRDHVSGLSLALPAEFEATPLVPVVDAFYQQDVVNHIHYDYGEKPNIPQPPQAGRVYHVALTGLAAGAGAVAAETSLAR